MDTRILKKVNEGKMDETPLVSVCCIAYNQKEYISHTLEGILMQHTNFCFEIIVHDDASTDGTDQIIRNYAENFPGIVKPIFQSVNKYSTEGLNLQYKYVFPVAKGKYLAFCEGDDFWIDPLKLQKQVDFLESNSQYGLVHTRAVQYISKTGQFGKTIGLDCSNFEKLITENTICNLTVCLRNDLFKKYIEEVKPGEKNTWTTSDFPIWLWFIQNSKVKFFNEVTAVYRVIDTSICHHKDDAKRLYFHEGLNDILDYYLERYGSDALTKKIRVIYTSKMINMVLLNRKREGILRAIKVFYTGKAWLNLIWLFMTLPFYRSKFLVKSSYYLHRNLIGYKNLN